MSPFSPIVLLLIAQATVSSAPRRPEPPPGLQIGLFSYSLDERLQGAAYETSLARESFQYVAGCSIGGGNRPIPETATDAWRLSGTVQSLTPEEAVVQLDWQRVRAHGVAVSAPGGSVQLTLHPGDRVALDSLDADATPQCPAKVVAFEARFGANPFTFARRNSSDAAWTSGSGVRGGTGGVGGRGAAGAAAGATVRVGAADATQTARPMDDNAAASREYSAELFLVRTPPGGAENTDFNLQGIVLQHLRGSAQFAFTPFTVATSAWTLNVQITGSLQVTSEAGAAQLTCAMIRTIRYTATVPTHGAGAAMVSGKSSTKYPMPGPDDVLSFELPPIRMPNSAETVPDQYSVRVRIR